MSAESTNRIPTIMVNRNRKSSLPRRLWKVALKLSPPNAPPRLEPRCCSKMAETRRMERIICTYGSAGSTTLCMNSIGAIVAETERLGKMYTNEYKKPDFMVNIELYSSCSRREVGLQRVF